MQENQVFETVADLVLQSVSVWEDLHLYAMTYSSEYNTFWELLDEDLKSTVCRYRNRNRKERRVPFTMSYIGYFKGLLSHETYARIKEQHWKKQLKSILADRNFRAVITNLNLELKHGYKSVLTQIENRTAAAEGNLRVSTHVVCANAAVLYNNVR